LYVTNDAFPFLMKEAQKNKDGAADHSTWRNYDDLNEFFWLDTMLLVV
jgi:callose synthase